jgi:hypothetical protein
MIRKSFKTIIILAVINISSCSVVGEFWYERIDQYIANQMLEYASFTENQKIFIRNFTEDYKSWNTETELPKYKRLLLQFKALDNQTDIDDIEDIYQSGIELSASSRDFLLPYLIELSKTLSKKQIKEIEIHLNKLSEEKRTSLKKETKDYDKILGKSFVRFFRLLGVKLNAKQKNIIRIHISNIEDTRYQLINNKEVWDQELIRILALKNNNNFNNLLIAHINALSSEDRNTRAVINNITAEIIASFDEKQSKKFQNKLGKFIRTIDNISEIKA